MANTLAASAFTAYETFYNVLADHAAWWMPLTDMIVEEDPTYTESDIYGLTEYAAQVASPTPKDLVASGSTTAVAAFEETVQFTIKEVNDKPGILVRTAAELAALGGWTLTNAMITAITTGDVTTHPEDGGSVYSAVGGGTVFFADAFDIDPPNDSTFLQQNLFLDGLDDTGLDAGLAARHAYKNKSGTPYHQGEVPFLIVPSELEGQAANLLGRTAELYDGSGLQLGSFGGSRVNSKPMVLPGAAADANDWWLWWRKIAVNSNGETRNWGPIIPWLRRAPSIRITVAQSTNHVNVVAYMEYAIHYRTFEGDYQMHKAA